MTKNKLTVKSCLMISIGILLLGTIGAVVAYQSRTTEFTLVGELPANLRLELMVSYEPKAGTDDCVTRKKVQPYKMYLFREVAKQTTDSHYQLTIPTFIKAEGCYLPIRSIKVTAHGQYGEYISYGKTYPKESMEQFAAFFSFFDTDKAEFLAAQPDQYRALCGWTFRILPKGLVKILSCREADKQWQLPTDRFKQSKVSDYISRNNLAGRKIELSFRVSLEERPYYRNSWIKTDKGWKRCIETEKTIRCQDPPTFVPFEMDGKTCTVYPNCIE